MLFYIFILAIFQTAVCAIVDITRTGDVWIMEHNQILTIQEAWKACHDLNGTLVEILSQSDLEDILYFIRHNDIDPNITKNIWTGGVRDKKNGNYSWKESGNSVNTTLLSLNETSCSRDQDCCSILLKGSAGTDEDAGTGSSFPCDSIARARVLCTVHPLRKLEAGIQINHHLILATKNQVDQLTMDAVANVTLLARDSKGYSSDIHGLMNDRVALYVLFSLNLVALVGLCAFVILINRRLNQEGYNIFS